MFTNIESGYLFTENDCGRSIEPLNWLLNWNLTISSNGSPKPPFLSA